MYDESFKSCSRYFIHDITVDFVSRTFLLAEIITFISKFSFFLRFHSSFQSDHGRTTLYVPNRARCLSHVHSFMFLSYYLYS